MTIAASEDIIVDVGTNRLAESDGLIDAEPFDLDLEIDTAPMAYSPEITSHFVCTPGCTSPGGGSFCSYCC